MDIETAANLGEALSGIAILFTLLFSLRQMKYWNENRRTRSEGTSRVILQIP